MHDLAAPVAMSHSAQAIREARSVYGQLYCFSLRKRRILIVKVEGR